MLCEEGNTTRVLLSTFQFFNDISFKKYYWNKTKLFSNTDFFSKRFKNKLVFYLKKMVLIKNCSLSSLTTKNNYICFLIFWKLFMLINADFKLWIKTYFFFPNLIDINVNTWRELFIRYILYERNKYSLIFFSNSGIFHLWLRWTWICD